MKRFMLLAAALGVIAVNASAGTSEAIRRAGLNELVAKLEKTAEAREDGKEIAEAEAKIQRRLKDVWYDAKSLPALRSALVSIRTDDRDLYIVNRLLKPLLMARTEVIREAMPAVKRQVERLGDFQKLPEYTDKQLRKYVDPEPKPSESDAATQRRREEVRELRDKKLAEEKLIQRHNADVKHLRQAYIKLLVLADTDEHDKGLLNRLQKAQKNQDWAVSAILATLRTHARDMDQDRAAWFYNNLKKLWGPHVNRAANYVDLGQVQLKDNANSTFAAHKAVFGRMLLTTINQLATTAKLPALRDPRRRQRGGSTKPPGRRR